MKIGKVLKLIRTSKGLNQAKAARALGISQNYLSLIETGARSPTNERISDFAKRLKISSDALLFLSIEPPKELTTSQKVQYIQLQREVALKFMI